MTPFDLAALLFVLAAAFGLLNHHLLKLPTTIGLVVIALAVSFALMGIDLAAPGLGIQDTVRGLVEQVDFEDALMNGMLSFLLFAGALHVDLEDLAKERWTVGVLATLGVLTSAFIVAMGLHLIVGLPFLVALAFGALISPTDPVAVMGILKTVRVPKSLEVRIGGESLLNDGVGVVVFLIVVALAFGTDGGEVGAAEALRLFAVEALGGAALGAGAGWLAYRMIRSVDDYVLEVIATLALVMGTYAVAHALHVSGPIAVVVAGLWIGNHGFRFGMSEKTRDHMRTFWHLIDEVLNAVLFLLIGFEVFQIDMDADYALAAVVAIPLVLFARFVSVSMPLSVLHLRGRLERGALAILTWGGLKGGISVALALSLPPSDYKPLLLTATYAVVIFSIVVQGLTVGRVIRAAAGERVAPGAPASQEA